MLALGLFIAFQTAQMTIAPGQAMVGPRLFPLLVATGLVVVGLALLREALFGHIAHEGGFELDWRAVALVGGGLIVQFLLLESLGWIIATTLLFVATTLAFGSRRLLIDAALGIALSGFAFVSFNYGLGLDLPVGTVVEQILTPTTDEAP